MEVAGANRRWRCQFRCRGSRRESAVAQLLSLGHITRHEIFRATFSAADALWLHRHCHKGALPRHDLNRAATAKTWHAPHENVIFYK
jgi:hypothetical protein